MIINMKTGTFSHSFFSTLTASIKVVVLSSFSNRSICDDSMLNLKSTFKIQHQYIYPQSTALYAVYTSSVDISYLLYEDVLLT